MITLDQKKIRVICAKNNIRTLSLVGSAVRQDFSGESDVDFLVVFNKTGRALDQYFNTLEDLKQLTGRRIDLIEESAIKNDRFRSGIEKDRVVLYEA